MNRKRGLFFEFHKFRGKLCCAETDFLPSVVTRRKTVALAVGEDKRRGVHFKEPQIECEVIAVATDLFSVIEGDKVTVLVLTLRGASLRICKSEVTRDYLTELIRNKPSSQLVIKQALQIFTIPRQLWKMSKRQEADLLEFFTVLHAVKRELGSLAATVRESLKKFRFCKRKRLNERERILQTDINSLEKELKRSYPDVFNLVNEDFEVIQMNLAEQGQDYTDVFSDLRDLGHKALEKAIDKATKDRCISSISWIDGRLGLVEAALTLYDTDTDQSDASGA